MARFTGHKEKWGGFIDVKQCGKRIDTSKLAASTTLIGSSTDPYNAFEKRYMATRKVLEQLVVSASRIEILTKSPLVLRDIDLLRAMRDVHVGISISTTDDGFAAAMEPHAPSPTERINAMRALREADVPVYAFVSPIFPFLSDYKNVVRSVEPFVEMVCFENLNLRGSYKQTVLRAVRENYPQQAEAFARVFDTRANFADYWTEVEREIDEFMTGKNYRVYFFHSEIKKK
jgi:DNA repair photolyase